MKYSKFPSPDSTSLQEQSEVPKSLRVAANESCRVLHLQVLHVVHRRLLPHTLRLPGIRKMVGNLQEALLPRSHCDSADDFRLEAARTESGEDLLPARKEAGSRCRRRESGFKRAEER